LFLFRGVICLIGWLERDLQTLEFEAFDFVLVLAHICSQSSFPFVVEKKKVTYSFHRFSLVQRDLTRTKRFLGL
jgi:hypothetical protein